MKSATGLVDKTAVSDEMQPTKNLLRPVSTGDPGSRRGEFMNPV